MNIIALFDNISLIDNLFAVIFLYSAGIGINIDFINSNKQTDDKVTNNKITGTLTKYLTENPNINTGISNSINCKKLSKFSISKYEAIGNDKTIKKINGAIKPRINI